jgi:hypothetical protein
LRSSIVAGGKEERGGEEKGGGQAAEVFELRPVPTSGSRAFGFGPGFGFFWEGPLVFKVVLGFFRTDLMNVEIGA